MIGATATETLDTEEQIEEAKASLDRIIAWINSCDTKAGTMLALVGVLLTIIFTNDGLIAIYELLKKVIPPQSFCMLLYIGLFGGSAALLICGIAHLVFTLIAQIDSNIYKEPEIATNSLLFFGSISGRTSYQSFREDILGMDKEEYLNDLLSQIYINSLITNEKYVNYNKGTKWTIIGFVTFIAMFLIGIYLY